MAGYGYTNRGGGNTNDWNRRSYYGENGGYPDEVRHPVVGDEARKRPIISYTAPNLSNSSASESYTRLEPVKDYGVTTNRWRGPSSPTNYDNPLLQNVEESADSTSRTSTRPAGYLSSTNWRNPSGTGATAGYGGEYTYANTNTNLNNSSNWNVRPNAYGNNIDGWESRSGRKGWAATSSDQGRDTLLSGPTNDIGKAVEILKDAASKSSLVASAVPQLPRFAFPAASTTGGGPTRDTYTYATDTNIDGNARRYGNFNLWSSRPSQQF